MSDEDGGLFYRHRKKIWALTLVGVSAVSLYGVYALGWIPSVAFLWSSTMLIVYAIVAVVAVVGLVVFRYRKGGAFAFSGGNTPVDSQLSVHEAKEFAERYLYEQKQPIFVDQDHGASVKPVSSDEKGEGENIRVFEWEFRTRGNDLVMFQMSLDQPFEWDSVWVQRQHPEDIDRIEEAVRNVMNAEVTMKSKTANFREAVEQKRQEIGQAVKDESVVLVNPRTGEPISEVQAGSGLMPQQVQQPVPQQPQQRPEPVEREDEPVDDDSSGGENQ